MSYMVQEIVGFQIPSEVGNLKSNKPLSYMSYMVFVFLQRSCDKSYMVQEKQESPTLCG